MIFRSKQAAEATTAISRQDNYLAKDILLKEASNPSYLRKTIGLTCAGMAAFLLWSTVAKVDVVTRAPGQLSPLSSVQVIQHLDGGRIKAINVAEGQSVRRGTVLIALDDSEAQADLETTRARYWALYGRQQRLRSFITGTAPDFSVIPEKYRQFAREEATILAIAQGSRADELRVIRAQMHQAASEASAVQELAEIRGDLAQEKLVSRTSYLDTVRTLNQLKGQQQSGTSASPQPITLEKNQGFHWIIGDQTRIAVPSGVYRFSLIGATTPTETRSSAPGGWSVTKGELTANLVTATLTGTMELFLSRSDGYGYFGMDIAGSLAGGINGTPVSLQIGVNKLSGSADLCTATCAGTGQLQFFGNDPAKPASHAGMTYDFNTGQGYVVQGAAVLGR